MRIDRQRNLAAVRRDVVVVRRRLPRLKRDTGARQRVAHAAGRDLTDEHVRLPPVGQPVIPEAILGAFGQMRFDLRFIAFLHPLALERFGR